MPVEGLVHRPEKKQFPLLIFRPVGQIAPDDADGSTAQGDGSSFLPLADDGYPLVD